MNAISGPVSAAVRSVVKVADATTAAAGAVGGAAVNGVVGGLQGAASGAKSGLSSGSHSTAAAALTLGAIGAAGLVEWPLLVAVGGAALVVHQLGRRTGDGDQALPASRQAASRPAAKTTGRAAKTARKTAASRRTST